MPDLIPSARRYAGIRLCTHLERVGWDGDELVLSCVGQLVDEQGLPVDHTRLPSDARHAAGGPHAASLVGVVVRERGSFVEFSVPGTSTRCGGVPDGDSRTHCLDSPPDTAAGFHTVARLDPTTVCGGEAMRDGVWDLYLRVAYPGLTRSARLGSRRTREATAGAVPAFVGPHATVVMPYWTTPYDNLSISISQSTVVSSVPAPDRSAGRQPW
jgi:hypothetical protein